LLGRGTFEEAIVVATMVEPWISCNGSFCYNMCFCCTSSNSLGFLAKGTSLICFDGEA
jgi:hypothetical protein